MINQFSNLSCYEEFEIQCTLTGVSKPDVLKEIGHNVDDYYFFISNDGIFNWFDLKGNHVEDPGILKEIKEDYIPLFISKCIIPDSVTRIGHEAFWDRNSLKEIVIPSGVTRIGEWAFSNCFLLKEIFIPNSVTCIGDEAFRYCTSLTSITIPNDITRIGYGVFYCCESLKEVIFKGKTLEEVKQMENYPFGIKDTSIIRCEI